MRKRINDQQTRKLKPHPSIQCGLANHNPQCGLVTGISLTTKSFNGVFNSLRPTSIPLSYTHPGPSPAQKETSSYTMALASRCCARLARSAVASPSLRLAPFAAAPRRWNSTASADPKIAGIVDQISGLTLLETADLVSLLKVRTFTVN